MIKNLIGKLKDKIDGSGTVGNTELTLVLDDIGNFVRFFPQGKFIAKNLKAKFYTMQLLEYDDEAVQKAALSCVSKMLVNNWEFLDAQGGRR